MTKQKFEVEVMRTDRYVIELDTEIMNEEWMEEFRQYMYHFDNLKEHADHIAQFRARFNNDNPYGGFQEGYGDLASFGKVNPNSKHPFPAVNFVKLDEDNDIEVFVNEL